jgi:hypothetical protein
MFIIFEKTSPDRKEMFDKLLINNLIIRIYR